MELLWLNVDSALIYTLKTNQATLKPQFIRGMSKFFGRTKKL